jgi:hypothetical protein
MLLIKLYKNKAFNKFLNDNRIELKFKEYHNFDNKIYRNIRYGDNSVIPEHFITLCMVKNGQNNINLICCNMISEDQSELHFIDKISSGLLLNGTFFILDQYIIKNYYGLTNPDYIYKTIGSYKYNMDSYGSLKTSDFNDAETPFVMDPPTYDATTNIIKHSILFAEEVCGMITIDNNNVMDIMTLDEFKKKLPLPDTTQCLFGHLLIHNNNIVLKEELMPIVYNIIPLNHVDHLFSLKPQLTRFKKCKILEQTSPSIVATPSYINRLRLNQTIYIQDIQTNEIYECKYNLSEIFTPYFMNLYKLSSSGSFAGDILPAMPSHASDLNPRTCIFRDKNNNVFFVNVEGRNKICGGMGLDLFDLATLCKSLGAVDAINLDGGGSSIMEIKEKNKPYSEHIGYYRYPIGNMIKISPK